jgi:(R,R)-butanediol dehydrogenase/meso-butanediol dehydrogenase/diacetyl reductase
MKVPVLVDLSKIQIQERPKPEVRSGEVLVKVEYCGICGSDVHGYLNGIMVPVGTVMGHECCGVVAEVGEGIQNFQPGDRVVVKPIPQCGKCYWCQRGQYSLCCEAFGRAIGISPNHDGAFAEYVRIEYPDEMLFKLPSNVSFEEAALIEPLATSLHGVRLSRFKPGDRVVVIGMGTIGLGVIQFLRLGGAGKIIVLEISSPKARIAQELGADVILNPLSEGESLRDRIFSLTDGVGADLVFDCAGVPFSFQTSINYVKSGGQVMVVGINDKEVPINPFMLVLWEVEMKGVLGYYDEFKYVIEFLDQKRIKTDLLISDIIPLVDLEEKGFKRLLASHDDVKILVKP